MSETQGYICRPNSTVYSTIRHGGAEIGLIGCPGALYVVALMVVKAPLSQAREERLNRLFHGSHPRLALHQCKKESSPTQSQPTMEMVGARVRCS
jgi:hypothetical protein